MLVPHSNGRLAAWAVVPLLLIVMLAVYVHSLRVWPY
jgi:hypothetical protein